MIDKIMLQGHDLKKKYEKEFYMLSVQPTASQDSPSFDSLLSQLPGDVQEDIRKKISEIAQFYLYIETSTWRLDQGKDPIPSNCLKCNENLCDIQNL